ncbi:MAG: hypothetical protein ACTS3T_21645, partial [Almyronema sp.]
GGSKQADIQAIAAAVQSGRLVLVEGQGAVGVGGDVRQSSIVSGSENIIGNHNTVIYIRGADAQTIQAALGQSTEKLCRDRQTLDQYLQAVLNRLQQQGCLDIKSNVISSKKQFNYAARISDFELPFGPLTLRGEAFFLFSEFASLGMPILQSFSGECLRWAKKAVNAKAAGQAFYNFRIPTHLCFAIALVDQLDSETRKIIQTTNPIDHRVDILWYEIPVAFELSQQKLYFYNKPANFFDYFKGEVAWQPIRTVIQQLLNSETA